jgi:D-threo-aldose 1-dehydrogenase
VSVIPGGQRPSEVESNRSFLDAKLPSALWADLKKEGLMRANAPTA